MYDIYIKNYLNSAGAMVTTETKLYSVPFLNEADNALIEPHLHLEMGKTGSLEFSVLPGHPYYSAWSQMKTLMRVVYDGDTIFRGRVLTIDNTLTGQKRIHLEGDLAFLMDSVQEGEKDADRTAITTLAYLQKLINNHNSQMSGEQDKLFTLGEVPGQYTSAVDTTQRIESDTVKFGNSGWTDTSSALNTLTNQYGGYFRTRYVNGIVYLDWLNNYFQVSTNTQPIEIGENLIDLSSGMEVENVFTAFIPIGKLESADIYLDNYRTDIHGANKWITVPQIATIFSDAELNRPFHSKADYQNAINKYGWIFKTQSFDSADTPDKLWTMATKWMLDNYMGGITSFKLTALDMHHLGIDAQKYLVGDKITVIYPDLDHISGTTAPKISKVFSLSSIDCYLHNPEKNNYSVGVPNGILGSSYGVTKAANTKSSQKGAKSAAQATPSPSGGGGGIKTDKAKDIVEELAWKYVVDGQHNSDIYQQVQAVDPQAAARASLASYNALVEILTMDNNPDASDYERRKSEVKVKKIVGNGATGQLRILNENPTDFVNDIQRRIDEGSLPPITSPEQMQELIRQVAVMEQVSSSIIVEGYGSNLNFVQKANRGLLTDPDTGSLLPSTYSLAQDLRDGTNMQKIMRMKLGLDPDGGKYSGTLVMRDFNPGTPTADDPLGLRTGSILDRVGIKGDTGNFLGSLLTLGDDGTGNTTKALLNGVTSQLTMGNNTNGVFQPRVALNGQQATFELGTNENGQLVSNVSISGNQNGLSKFGKASNGDWLIKINDTVTYTDVSGVQRTVSGFITAQDLNLPEVPSFKTKIAQIDNLIAAKATIGELRAFEALLGDGTPVYNPSTGKWSFEGTTLQTNANQILGVSGSFEIDETTGDLIVISGGGFKIKKNNVEYGVYDEGNLTGGLIVNKVNNQSVTKIRGDKIVVGNANDELDDWVAETDSGLVAVKASIKTLQADLVDANKIQARISSLDTLVAKSIIISGGGTLSTTGYVAAGEIKTSTLTLGGKSVTSLLKDASVSGNVLTITKHDGSTVTFSKATTLEGGWSGGTYTVTASPQGETTSTTLQSLVGNGDVSVSSSGKIVSQNFYVTYGENGDTSFIQTGANLQAAINATPVYNNGWAAAWSKLSIPYAPNYTGSMTVKYPGVTVDTFGDDAVYTVSADDDYAYIKRGGITVARASHSAYSDGWAAAWSKLSIPYAPNYSDSMTVEYPGVTADTSGDPAVYTVSADNSYAYIKRGGTTVARVSHSAYSNGEAVGHANAIPINGTAGGRAAGVSALVHDFSISSVDGTKTTVKIDCTSIYNTARTGYTAGTFTLTPVTLQGSAYGDITPIGTAHKFTYTHLYKAGTAVTYYNSGSNVTYYQGNGSSVTGRGDSVSVTPIGTAHKLKYTRLYKTQSANAEVQWAYVADSSGSTTWYSAGTTTTYYKGNGSSVTGRGSTVTVTTRGSAVTVTPIGSTQWAYVGDSNGSTVYYDKGTTVTGLRRAGETNNTTYYTKS